MRSVGNVLLGYECTKDAPLLSYGGRLHGGPRGTATSYSLEPMKAILHQKWSLQK